MKLEAIRKHYGVPAKRGMKVWLGDDTYIITGAPRGGGMYINVKDGDGRRYTVHPYDLDYMVDGKCFSGLTAKKKYDDAWDRFNAVLATPASSGQDAGDSAAGDVGGEVAK